jgi:hypothetical protein
MNMPRDRSGTTEGELGSPAWGRAHWIAAAAAVLAVPLAVCGAAAPASASSASGAATSAGKAPATAQRTAREARPASGRATQSSARSTGLWVRRYSGPGNGLDAATSVAVSPSGAKVFVTGYSQGRGSGLDYATVAYDADNGARLWVARYNGPGNSEDNPSAIAVSPDGARVFVTGQSAGVKSDLDYATVAYNAATGRQLWVARYNGPANGPDRASAVSVAPGGSIVYVTGESPEAKTTDDYATVAYIAATGRQLWVKRYTGPADEAAANAVISPGGNRVFVTGFSRGGGAEAAYATVAYNAATGKQLWVRRYHGTGGLFDVATALAASPGATRVYVTGRSFDRVTGGDYATVAYNAATGAELWVKRYNGPANERDDASAIAVSRGGTVAVTGSSPGIRSNNDYATVAYSPTGRQLWVKRYNGPGNGNDNASAVAAPSNGRVYVTGTSWGGHATRNDIATVAYNIFTGQRLWVRRYNGPLSNGDYAGDGRTIATRAGKVFVTGPSFGISSNLDYVTIAYRS